MSENDLNILTARMDAGFEKIWQKLDEMQKDFAAHRIICIDKFAGIDSRFAVSDAVGCIKQKEEREKLDLWKWIIRGTTGIIALGSATLIWKLLIGTAEITIR